MPSSTKISSKTTEQIVSPIAGAILGFYYQPMIGFLIALAFGFQESPFKLNIKNKYFGCRVNWQLFLIYFVLGLAFQVLNTLTLALGLATGVGLRWYFSDGDLEKYSGYIEIVKEYLKKYGLSLNYSIIENTEWFFQYLHHWDKKNDQETVSSPSNDNLDSFLNSSPPEPPHEDQEDLLYHQENPSNVSNPLTSSGNSSGIGGTSSPSGNSSSTGGMSSGNPGMSSGNSSTSSNPSGLGDGTTSTL